MSEENASTALGVALSLLILGVLLFILFNTSFPESTLITNQMISTSPGSDLGPLMSRFLWDFRGLDLTCQTILLFATAVSVLALLREELTG